MEKVTDIALRYHEASSQVTRHFRFEYDQNKTHKEEKFLFKKNGVQILLYNTTRKVFVFVKQFRPPVYINGIPAADRALDTQIDPKKYPAKNGLVLELCGGIVTNDDASERLVARDQVLEECGYQVNVEDLEAVSCLMDQVADSATFVTLYYCEVEDSMKVGEGGGVGDEIIEVVEMPVAQAMEYCAAKDVNSPVTVLAGFLWFLRYKYNK